ncbi:hypothetical protein [uncultured Methylobacterium sp.]|jgi:flagellar hook-associated protein 3 FlgL|uniref:hypothetical protein n=1 Tax=uncultured Methylobacterium sp. TaxID=157278 RepID=UPI002618B1D4|nr:hypothetical protein [uncultured Methylobacterium sp.]
MTIRPFAAGTYTRDLNTSRLLDMKGQLDGLSRQLATGRISDSYAGLGAGRTTSLDARAQISALDGYAAGITAANTRLSLATASIAQVQKLATATWSELDVNRSGSEGSARANLKTLATNRFATALDALSQNVSGSYLFSGRATTTPPVEEAGIILNGDAAAGLAGIGTLIKERQAADLGTGSPSTGRLVLTGSGTAIGLSESLDPGVRANFGFTIEAAASTNPGALGVTLTAGSPAAAALAFAAQPRDGDRVRVTVENPDGSQGFVDLTASSDPKAGAGSFRIGANAAESAANLTAALGGATVTGAQSGTPPGVSAALSGGSAASAAVAVTGQPVAGDSVRITLGMRDGTTRTLTLTAAVKAGAANTFAIGADTAETARNLKAALGTALDAAATTDLAASSATRTADDFFAGSSTAGLSPRRVVTDAAGNATGFAADPGGRTVIWYKGDDTSTDPRTTTTVQISAGQTVGIGAQANESALRSALAGIAVVASVSFAGGASDDARFQAYATRIQDQVKPSGTAQTLEGIATEFGLAVSAVTTQKADNAASKSILQNAVDGVESASMEEVATKLMTLQTQLQASYQTTSTLAKLTLANYL